MYYELILVTSEILASKYGIDKGQTLPSRFFTAFCLLLRLKVFRSITFKLLYDLDIEYSDAAV